MIDPTPTDDELISSYLDGEATLDEVARVEADPSLSARVQQFQAAKDLLSTPVEPLSDSDVDHLIDNALAQSATSDRVIDLAAARGQRSFRIAGLGSPQRIATVAAALVLLAGVVGAMIALNSDTGNEMFASTSNESADMSDDYFGDDMADGDDMAFDADMAESDMAESDMGFGDDMADGDDMAFDADMAESDMAESDMAESDMGFGDDMADEMFDDGESFDAGDDMAAEDDYPSDEMAQSDETDETDEAPADAEARMQYRLLGLEIAERYETLDSLVDHATEQWRELVAAGATAVPQVAEEQGIAEQALAEAACGQELHAHIDTLDHSAGSGGVSVGETTIAGSPTTVVVVELSIDTAAVLTAAVLTATVPTDDEPGCEIAQLADLNP